MAVDMGIRHRDSGEYEFIAIASQESFQKIWMPAAQGLGLERSSTKRCRATRYTR